MPNILNIFRRAATPSSSSEEISSPGSAILSKLDRLTQHHSLHAEYVVGSDDRSLPVNGDRLLNVGGPDRRPAVPLDASRLSPSAVLMASPDGRADLSACFNACVHNRIGHVVDLTDERSPTADLFSGKPWIEPYGASTQVAVHPLTPKANTKYPDVFGHGASESWLDLRAGNGPDSVSQEVKWMRFPGVPKKMLPEALLGVCRRLMESKVDGTSVAFMDRSGGSVAATFAAANAIFRSHLRQPLTPRDAADEVAKACALQRMTRSHELYKDRPDLLEALEGFTLLLIQQGVNAPTRFHEDVLAELAATADDPQDVPRLADQTGPQPRRSAMKQPEIYETTPEQRKMDSRKLAVGFERQVKVSEFELFQAAKETDRMGEQGELDNNDEKPKTRSLKEKLEHERNPHAIDNLRTRLTRREVAKKELQAPPSER